jgi:alpha/beta superfamily hydrolase
VAAPLPPPPDNPALSPPVTIADEVPVMVPGLPGEPALEGMIRAPEGARRAVLLCHPHPLYGGTMHSAVVVILARVLAQNGAADVATLRFNYRGVGASGGAYGEGKGETFDTRAAIRLLKARAPQAEVAVCGYSFGTWVALQAATLEGGVERVGLVAPAVRLFDFTPPAQARPAFPGGIAVYVGDEDEFCSVDEARELSRALGAHLSVFEKSDHFFLRSRRKLAVAVVPFLAPGISTAA